MIAKSVKGISPDEIKSALNESMSDGFNPTLAIAFLSSNLDIKEITNFCSSHKIAVFGATAATGFTDGDFNEGSSAILLLDLDPSCFKIFFAEIPENFTQSTANQMGEFGLKSFTHPAYIVATSGRNIEFELLIEKLEDFVGPSLYIFGGRAGNIANNVDTTYVFDNTSFSSNALAALVIDEEKIQLSGLTSHGWKPLGNEHTVTKSAGRTVYMIDDQPALDVFTRFLGVALNDSIQEEIEYNLDQLGPVQIVRETGNSVIRDVSFFNRNDHSVIFQSEIPEGTKFRFSLPPDFDIVEVLPEECLKLKNEKNVEAEAVIMFSCSGRKLSLGPMINQEIEKVKNTWESPMAGFFSFGEIGRSEGGGNEFHNYTSCLVILKEK